MNSKLSYIDKHAKKSDLSFIDQTFNIESIGQLMFDIPGMASNYEESEATTVVDQPEINRTSGHLFAEKQGSEDGSPVDVKISRENTVNWMNETQKNEEN